MDYLIEARKLTKVYGDGVAVPALRGVDLQAAQGSFIAITGPSGSGKSTLLHILGALEPPTQGQLLLDGMDIGALSDNQRTLFRRQKIGFVFQQFNLLPVFTALENVALPMRLDRVPPDEANGRAAELLELVGLGHRREHFPSQLSGGEQQRVAIARALIAGPALLLADEPTGALDRAMGDQILAVLRRLVDEHGHTVVLVTHDSSVAWRTQRVVCMRDGLVVDDFDPRRRAQPSQGLAAAVVEKKT